MSSTKLNGPPRTLKWAIPDEAFIRTRADACLKRTDWKALCDIASRTNAGQSCKPLPAYTVGGSSLARLFEFQDGTCWIARVQMARSTLETSRRLRTDVDTMAMLKAHTKAPVPRVFASETDDANPTGVAFVLLEFFPGNTAMDEAREYKITDLGLIPSQFRQTFYHSMAAAHVQIASARLPQIGTVIRDENGSFTVGPIPGIGGPFDTAASFVQAWAAHIQYPYDQNYIRGCVPPHFIDKILEGIEKLPKRLAELAISGKYFKTGGPFPIRHTDLWHSNIVVTTMFNVLGVIDWEGAYTVPWELIDAPRFLYTIPRLLNPPEQYSEDGEPLDQDEIVQWAEKANYAVMVRQAEQIANTDHMLSNVLSDKDSQDLAATFHLFGEGKIGLYSRALDYFESK